MTRPPPGRRSGTWAATTLLAEEPQIHLTCSCQGPRLVASLVPELARSSVRDLGLCRVTAQTEAASRTEKGA